MRSVILLLSLLLLSPTAFSEDSEEEAAPEIIYMALTPQFTVNLLGNKHYLRASIQLQVTDNDTKSAIQKNDPAIRHTLIVLLSNNLIENVSSTTGKLELQDKAVIELNKTLEKYTNSSGVEKVFFTEFVAQ
ncbi:MAG: flagellar basal body-associated FliL family protein [Cycloclasticus sp.]|nr:flagellar biosynthesis protein FliL [Cycloclasticus sp. 46_83_sub15_T18]OUR82936.1 flagellar biosynthesis protein FliL [Cycloclasticus sp. 46_120_T64]